MAVVTRWHNLSRKEFIRLLEHINEDTLISEYPPLEIIDECIHRLIGMVDDETTYGQLS
jgi:hypothetical protein